MTKSSLDDIEGIGAKRKKDLLNHFGSVAAIKDASVEDIAKVVGINKKQLKTYIITSINKNKGYDKPQKECKIIGKEECRV